MVAASHRKRAQFKSQSHGSVHISESDNIVPVSQAPVDMPWGHDGFDEQEEQRKRTPKFHPSSNYTGRSFGSAHAVVEEPQLVKKGRGHEAEHTRVCVRVW